MHYSSSSLDLLQECLETFGELLKIAWCDKYLDLTSPDTGIKGDDGAALFSGQWIQRIL